MLSVMKQEQTAEETILFELCSARFFNANAKAKVGLNRVVLFVMRSSNCGLLSYSKWNSALETGNL